eukprot:5936020-Alexandrium_andersonii.AAC.1
MRPNDAVLFAWQGGYPLRLTTCRPVVSEGRSGAQARVSRVRRSQKTWLATSAGALASSQGDDAGDAPREQCTRAGSEPALTDYWAAAAGLGEVRWRFCQAPRPDRAIAALQDGACACARHCYTLGRRTRGGVSAGKSREAAGVASISRAW